MRVEIFEMFSGIGSLTRALVDGLSRHVEAKVVGCLELEARYLKPWSEQHPEASTFAGSCGLYHASEVSIPKAPGAYRIGVFGIPCTGASRAGASKNRLACAEEHGDVGHLFLYVAHYIRRHQPDCVIFENVIPYVKSFSAKALRETLAGLGYSVCEREIDSFTEFGAPTQRQRWTLIATRSGQFNWNYTPQQFAGTIERFLDAPSELDEAESFNPERVAAAAKYNDRKKAEGTGFAMRLLYRDSPKVPTICKCYGKIQPTGVFLKTKTSYRMLRPREVARIMGFPEDFPLPEAKITAYEVIGQGVHMTPFTHLGAALGEWLAGGQPDLPDADVMAQLELAMA